MKIKELLSNFIRYILVLSIFTIYFINPVPVSAKHANTLAGLRSELKELETKKRDNANKKALTQSEIRSNASAIENAKSEITVSRNKIDEAKILIEKTDKKITELKNKNEELMAYFQVMQGENIYLEFITDSSSMTELIMRSDAINQLVEYQQQKLLEMNDLIKENEQLQVDMIKHEEELENNIVKYDAAIDSLQGDLSSLNEIGLDLDDEIKSRKELIDTYVKMGCKENQDLDECASLVGNSQWLKPFAKGRVNSIYGTRISPITGKKSVHQAVDIGGNPEGTKVYAVGYGRVISMVDATGKYNSNRKTTCGGNQLYLQVMIAGEYYVIGYAHLLEIHVKVGDEVTPNTVVGLQGGGPKTKKWETCSTGTHLHLSVAKGKYEPTKETLSKFLGRCFIKPPGYPNKGGWFYSRTQFFK